MGAEAGHEIRTTIGGRNGQSKQVSEHLIGDVQNVCAISWCLVSFGELFLLWRWVLFTDRPLVT